MRTVIVTPLSAFTFSLQVDQQPDHSESQKHKDQNRYPPVRRLAGFTRLSFTFTFTFSFTFTVTFIWLHQSTGKVGWSFVLGVVHGNQQLVVLSHQNNQLWLQRHVLNAI